MGPILLVLLVVFTLLLVGMPEIADWLAWHFPARSAPEPVWSSPAVPDAMRRVKVTGELSVFFPAGTNKHLRATNQHADEATRGGSLLLPRCMRETSSPLIWAGTSELILTGELGSYSRVQGIKIRVVAELELADNCPPGLTPIMISLPGLDAMGQQIGWYPVVRGSRKKESPFQIGTVHVRAKD